MKDTSGKTQDFPDRSIINRRLIRERGSNPGQEGISERSYPEKHRKSRTGTSSKGSAHCEGPLDHLLIVRYDCFLLQITANKFVRNLPHFSDKLSNFYHFSVIRTLLRTKCHTSRFAPVVQNANQPSLIQRMDADE